jgi:hypothetical protein
MLLEILASVLAILGQPSGSSTTEGVREAKAPNLAILTELARIEKGMRSTLYRHTPRIIPAKGIYEWDCSIMVGWILDRATPKARRALPAKPLARDFYDVIAKASPESPRRHWLRISGPQAVEPGDVFAWRKAEVFKSHNNTGHVGFVLGKPWQHPRFPSIWVMRIADSTRAFHEQDSRPVDGDGGFGTAVVAFLFDDRGEAVAYGWYGEAQDPETYVETHIVFGRAVR